jgi:hypothetical protein
VKLVRPTAVGDWAHTSAVSIHHDIGSYVLFYSVRSIVLHPPVRGLTQFNVGLM